MIGKRRVNIPPERWAKMLRDAKAPEPWDDPDAPGKFAEEIKNRTWDEPKPSRTVRKKMQVAISTLRDKEVRVEMVRSYERKLAPDNLALSRRIAVRDLAGALQHLEQAVPIDPPRSAPAWQQDAILLFGLFQQHVARKTGISASGPATSFIRAALEAIGHGTVELGTIAQALQRWRKTRTTKSV
jgi:hypothetical protein